MRDGRSHGAIGKYQLIASLGQGGMANVYLALVAGPAGVNKLMVVKVLASEMLHGPEGGLDLFWDEARLATRLVHPNIVHTYEVGEADGDYFLAMEYLEGQTLRAVQTRAAHEPLRRADALRVLSEVARGLQYAHELRDFHGSPLNVVHRDVSPQNVFVTYDGQVKLIDFGIAKTRDAGHETQVGLIKGKLNYIAPEQLRGDALDRRVDVFALGVMLWEAVAGRRFAGGSHVSELAKVNARLKGDEPNIRSVEPDVPESLASIIDRALQLDVNKRWSDAAAFADAIDAYIDSTGDRPSSRSLAIWMQQRFAHDRAAMHTLIDERMQLIVQNSLVVEIDNRPTLPPLMEGTGSGTWAGAERSGIKSSPAQGTQEPPPGKEPARAGRTLQSALLGALAVFAVAAVARLMPIERGTPDAATEPRVVAAVSAPETASPHELAKTDAPAAPNVTIRVTASPASAHVSIDGAAVNLPFSGAFIRSEALHRIEATAKGHKSVARLVDFTHDQAFELVLAPVVEVAPRRAASAPRTHAERSAAPLPVPSASQEARAASDTPAKPPEAGTSAIARMAAASSIDRVMDDLEPASKPAEKLVPAKELPGNQFPPYPRSAQRRGHTGSVVVAFDVLPDGRVTNPKIVEGPEEFHEVVLKTALTWRFQPATLGGKPVGQRRTKTIKFDLEDT